MGMAWASHERFCGARWWIHVHFSANRAVVSASQSPSPPVPTRAQVYLWKLCSGYAERTGLTASEKEHWANLALELKENATNAVIEEEDMDEFMDSMGFTGGAETTSKEDFRVYVGNSINEMPGDWMVLNSVVGAA